MARSALIPVPLYLHKQVCDTHWNAIRTNAPLTFICTGRKRRRKRRRERGGLVLWIGPGLPHRSVVVFR